MTPEKIWRTGFYNGGQFFFKRWAYVAEKAPGKPKAGLLPLAVSPNVATITRPNLRNFSLADVADEAAIRTMCMHGLRGHPTIKTAADVAWYMIGFRDGVACGRRTDDGASQLMFKALFSKNRQKRFKATQLLETNLLTDSENSDRPEPILSAPTGGAAPSDYEARSPLTELPIETPIKLERTIGKASGPIPQAPPDRMLEVESDFLV